MAPSHVLKSLVALLSLGTLTAAHMEMSFPPPLKSKFNTNTASGQADYSMTSPLNADGSNFPCKGYQSLLGSSQGASVATFSAGQKYNYTIVGGANHDGGSCQASLSYDGGKTFTVIGSVVGGCPGVTSSNFDFTVPSDAPSGAALFTWTWFNEVGNREMYMNCASVTIGGGSAKRDSEEELAARDSSTAFKSRPSIFVANVGTAGNGCSTTEETDVMFPNPGPDLVQNPGAKPAPPVCPNGVPSGSGSSGSGSGSGSGSTPASASAAPVPAAAATSSAPAAAAPPPAPTSVVPAAAPTSATGAGGVFVTVSGSPGAGSEPPAPTSAAEPAPVPATTMQTVTTPAAAAAPSVPAAGASNGTEPTGASGGSPATTASQPQSTGSSTAPTGSTAVGQPCSDEGAWNCIGGNSFSRCASGTWSAIIQMAAGTSCTPGISDNLFAKRAGGRSGPRRRYSAWAPVQLRQ